VSTRTTIAIVLGALAATGCFKSSVRSGLPPSEPPEYYDDLWHSGWLGGAIEASGPHDLASICPQGWSQIDTKTDASQGFVTLITLGIYAPQSVTVVCAKAPSSKTLAPPPPKPF
jgi:hypothetical protein